MPRFVLDRVPFIITHSAPFCNRGGGDFCSVGVAERAALLLIPSYHNGAGFDTKKFASPGEMWYDFRKSVRKKDGGAP